MKLVFDTDVILSGLVSETGSSRALLLAALHGVVQPVVSVANLIEYEAVLKRPEKLAQMGLNDIQVDTFLDTWMLVATPVWIDFQYRPSIRDPNDEMNVETAINGAAAAIVTFNVNDYQPADPWIAKLGVEICRPSTILRKLTWRPDPDMLSVFRIR